VTEAQKKAKQKVIKQEQKAEKIIEILAERNDVSVKQLYNEVSKKLFDHYEMLFLAFQDVVENDVDLRDYGVSDDIAPPLHELIREKIKPQRVTIGGTLTLTTYASDGVQVIKDALDDATEYEGTEVQYSGAGQYKVTVTAPDYKEAEAILDKSVKAATTVVEENKGAAAFERT
jgi:translation initiation factor 2 subunit 1